MRHQNWPGGFWVFVLTAALLTILFSFYSPKQPNALASSLILAASLLAGARAVVKSDVPSEEESRALFSYFFYALLVSVLVFFLYITVARF